MDSINRSFIEFRNSSTSSRDFLVTLVSYVDSSTPVKGDDGIIISSYNISGFIMLSSVWVSRREYLLGDAPVFVLGGIL